MTLILLAALLGIGTGVLFGWVSSRQQKRDDAEVDPTAQSVLRDLGGMATVYTLGACAFILGYIGWWGGIDPPEGSMPGLMGAFRNPGLIIVLGCWLAGFASFQTWKG